MSPATADLVAALEAERLRPITRAWEAYPDGPTAWAMREELCAAVEGADEATSGAG